MKDTAQCKNFLSTKEVSKFHVVKTDRNTEPLDGDPSNFQYTTGSQKGSVTHLSKPEDISGAHITQPHVTQPTIFIISLLFAFKPNPKILRSLGSYNSGNIREFCSLQ